MILAASSAQRAFLDAYAVSTDLTALAAIAVPLDASPAAAAFVVGFAEASKIAELRGGGLGAGVVAKPGDVALVLERMRASIALSAFHLEAGLLGWLFARRVRALELEAAAFAVGFASALHRSVLRAA